MEDKKNILIVGGIGHVGHGKASLIDRTINNPEIYGLDLKTKDEKPIRIAVIDDCRLHTLAKLEAAMVERHSDLIIGPSFGNYKVDSKELERRVVESFGQRPYTLETSISNLELANIPYKKSKIETIFENNDIRVTKDVCIIDVIAPYNDLPNITLNKNLSYPYEGEKIPEFSKKSNTQEYNKKFSSVKPQDNRGYINRK